MADKQVKIIAWVLGMVVVLPLFALLISHQLGKIHRPHAPRKMWVTGVTESTNREGEKVYDSIYQVIPNYKFQTQNGDSLALDSLHGKIYVADFFFATCPGICPKLSNSLEKVQDAFVKDNNFRIVSFSVDPAKDTLQALRQYASLHNAVPGKWFFLRGSKEDVFNLALKGFHVTAKDDPDGGAEAFIHSEKLVLVDQDGNVRGYYSGVDSNRVKQMMGDIVLLLRSTEQGFSFDKKKNN